jgi:tetratricopeptide (TPR) repeat protein
MYGYVAAMRGTNLEAATDFKKELALHPDEQRVYLMLASAQMLSGSRDDAKQTLKSGLAQGPNIDLAMMLGPLLEADGAFADEAKVLEPVSAKQLENEQLRLMLGRAEMRDGSTDEGSKVLVALLKSTDSARILNDASYELADKSMDMELAETSALKALDMMTKESSALALATDPKAAKAQARMLAASWDTMGWVYFKEHKLDEAEDYVRAAWLSYATPDGGLHLGQLEEAQGKLSAALKTYEMALTITEPHAPNQTTDPDAATKQEIRRRVTALKRKGVRDRSTGEPFTELQDLRMLRIGPAEGRTGTSDYKVLMAGGHVEALKGPDDNTVRNADAMVQKVIAEGWWPKDSQVKMVREGILNCHSGVCEFVMVPLQ